MIDATASGSADKISGRVPGRGVWLIAGGMSVLLALACGVLLTKEFLLTSVVAIAGLALMVSVRRPEFATVAFAFLLYVNAPVVAHRDHGMPHAAAAGIAGLLLIPVIRFLVIERKRLILAPALPWMLAFLGVQFVSMLLAWRKEEAWEAVLGFTLEGLVIFALVTNAVRTPATLRRVTWALILAGVVMAGLGIVQKATGQYSHDFLGFAKAAEAEMNRYGEVVGERWAAGPIGEKNYYAQFLLMLFPLALSRFWHERSRGLRLLGLAAAIIILGGVGLTASRGAAVAFLLMLALMVVLGNIRLHHLLLVGFAAFFLLLAMPAHRQRLLSTIDVVHVLRGEAEVRRADAAVQGRLSEMAAAVLVFQEHPLLGVGPGNFPYYFPDKADLLGFQIHGNERRAHCLLLEIAAETGILGIFCFLLILGIIARDLLRARQAGSRTAAGGMAAAYFFLLVVMTVTGIFLSLAYIRYYWFAIALASAAAGIAARQQAVAAGTGAISNLEEE